MGGTYIYIPLMMPRSSIDTPWMGLGLVPASSGVLLDFWIYASFFFSLQWCGRARIFSKLLLLSHGFALALFVVGSIWFDSM